MARGDLTPRGGKRVSRREREQRAYLLGLTATGAGVLTVLLLVLAILGIVGAGPVLLSGLVAGGAAYGFRRTVS